MSKKTINILGNILMVLSFIFIIRRIIKYNIDFREVFISYTPFVTVMAIILYAAFVITLANLFNSLLQMHMDGGIPFNSVVSIYCKSNLFKYLPGNIFHYVGRNQIAFEGGISHSKVIYASILEMFFLVIAALLVSVIFAGQHAINWIIEDTSKEIVIGSIFLAAAILCIILIKFNSMAREWIESFIEQLNKIKFTTIVKFILFYAGTFIFNGIIFTFILSSIGKGLYKDLILSVIGIYAFSWIVGFITPGAPAGLGIREAMMCNLLSGAIKEDAVITAIVLYRFITIFGDVIAYLTMYNLKGIKK